MDEIKLELFGIKQKFLREIPHPKLILKEIKQLELRGKIDHKNDTQFQCVHLTEVMEKMPLAEFLDLHIKDTLLLKQFISLASDYSELIGHLRDLYFKQVQLLKKLKDYLPEMDSYPDKDLMMSTPIDSYAILKRISTLKLKENEIKDYLCKVINAVGEQVFDQLTEACLRANKIILHV